MKHSISPVTIVAMYTIYFVYIRIVCVKYLVANKENKITLKSMLGSLHIPKIISWR